MSCIFISYRRSDAAAEAGRIYDYLENQFGRESIFKDVDAIDIGDNFRDRIHEAVGQCQILLAVIGQNWLQAQDAAGRRRLENPADWVRLEIETALNRNVRVIPVLLDGVEMPAMGDLPKTLQPLVYRTAAHVRHDPDFRRDMDRVLEVIKRMIANLPELSTILPILTLEALLTRGFENYKAKRYEEAIADYDQALHLNPDCANAYFNRGLARYRLGDKQGAITNYDQALRLNPDDAIAYFNRALAKSTLGDHQGSVTDYDQALRLDPDLSNAHRNRALAKSALGDHQGSITDYDQALRLDPNFAVGYLNRGVARSALGDKQNAITDYDQALRLDPDFAVGYLNRGVARSALGDKQNAITDLKKAARLCAQQGDMERHNYALDQLKNLEQRGLSFWERLS